MAGKSKSQTSTSPPHKGNQRNRLTIAAVKSMFPKRHHKNVAKGYEAIERAFENYINGSDGHGKPVREKVSLDPDQKEGLRLYIYATVAAETGNFVPRIKPVNGTNTL